MKVLSRSRSMAVIAITACGVLASACGGGAATTEGAADEVTIAGGDQIGAAQFLVAEADGLWANQGLAASRQSYPSGRDALNALLGGQADFATIGDLPVVTAVLSGSPVRVVANLSWGTQWRVLTTDTSGVSELAHLRGKRIGVTEGTNTQYLLSRILTDSGLTADDVTVVNLAANQVPVALNAGDIDAGVTFPTFYDVTRQTLGDRYREIIYNGYQSPTMLIAQSDVPDDRIADVLAVLGSAQESIDADPTAAQQAVVAGSNNSITPDNVAALWPLYRIELGLSSELGTALVDEARWATTALPISVTGRPEDLSAALYPGPLRTVAPELVDLP